MKLFNLVAAVALSASSIANATLITNGGFEDPNISSGWTYLSDAPGGWEGDNIEVWASGFNGVNSYEGTQHGELNAHPYDGTSFSIYQSFATTENALYDVSLAYRARSSNNESFRLELFTGAFDSKTHLIDIILDSQLNTWNTYFDSFYGNGSETYLMLTSIVPDTGTVGNFIDAVSVTEFQDSSDVPEVSEPATLALLGLGLAGLAGARRKAK